MKGFILKYKDNNYTLYNSYIPNITATFDFGRKIIPRQMWCLIFLSRVYKISYRNWFFSQNMACNMRLNVTFGIIHLLIYFFSNLRIYHCLVHLNIISFNFCKLPYKLVIIKHKSKMLLWRLINFVYFTK